MGDAKSTNSFRNFIRTFGASAIVLICVLNTVIDMVYRSLGYDYVIADWDKYILFNFLPAVGIGITFLLIAKKRRHISQKRT